MNGYDKLKEAVICDCNYRNHCGCFNENGCDKENHKVGDNRCFHAYCDTFKWAIERAKHYAEKLNLNWEDVLNSWEEDRDYWYMNYYQEANQPTIKAETTRIFETIEAFKSSLKDKGFRCPSCGEVSKSPYECDKCDWKSYGLFGCLNKGIFVYVKEKLKGQTIFMPIAWEGK